MSEEQTRSKSGDPESDNTLPAAPWPQQAAVLLRQLIQKITDQPFLFVIAIALLLITFTLQGAEVGGPEFRLVVLIIGLLAVFGMIGYYLMQLQPDSLEPEINKPAPAAESLSPSGIGSEKPSLPQSFPSTPLPAANQDVDVWVKALEQSPTIQNPSTRQAVLDELPLPIRSRLNDRLPNLATQLRDLVRTCKNYPGGLGLLVEAVQKLEEDTVTVQHLRSLL